MGARNICSSKSRAVIKLETWLRVEVDKVEKIFLADCRTAGGFFFLILTDGTLALVGKIHKVICEEKMKIMRSLKNSCVRLTLSRRSES